MASIGHWTGLIFRLAYGLFFLGVGLYGSYSLMSGGGNPFSAEPGPGARFQAALDETGFVIPIMLTCYIIGGAALLFRRTAPLGIVLLAPFVVVIFFYHAFLDGSLIWAVLSAGGLAVLTYSFRERFGFLIGLSPGDTNGS